MTRQLWSKTYKSIVEAGSSSDSSKLTFLALRLQAPGRPIHLLLDGVARPVHRAALASFLCSDWFFGKHARNYFAKNLLPALPRHLAFVNDLSLSANTVCLACWHSRRQLALEDEFHVICACPEYRKARSTFLQQVSPTFALDSSQDLLNVLSCSNPLVLNALGSFLARVRQNRRQLKLKLERYSNAVLTSSFAVKRAAWRFKGRPSCRHGVLFGTLPPDGCRCMATHSEDSDWQAARYMPALDHELKIIVAKPFLREQFVRLVTLQHRARTLGW